MTLYNNNVILLLCMMKCRIKSYMLIAMIIGSQKSHVVRTSLQSDAHLIEGQGKNFTCESYIHSYSKSILYVINNLNLTTLLLPYCILISLVTKQVI